MNLSIGVSDCSMAVCNGSLSRMYDAEREEQRRAATFAKPEWMLIMSVESVRSPSGRIAWDAIEWSLLV